jgi:hypothetical protein
MNSSQDTQDTMSKKDLGQSFTLKQIRKWSDWDQWCKERYKMLYSYYNQGMFSKPMEALMHANIHHMLWHYSIKMCGARMARMVCDSSAWQGTITLGHTFANSLDAPSEHLFWAIVAKRGLTAYGADCSNAFVKAPPPKHPLYMRIDEAYQNWWVNHMGRSPIPLAKTVVQIQNSIEGHPEFPSYTSHATGGLRRYSASHPYKWKYGRVDHKGLLCISFGGFATFF